MDEHVRSTVLVVRNAKKGTTLIIVITINVVKTVVKYGVVSRDPHVSKHIPPSSLCHLPPSLPSGGVTRQGVAPWAHQGTPERLGVPNLSGRISQGLLLKARLRMWHMKPVQPQPAPLSRALPLLRALKCRGGARTASPTWSAASLLGHAQPPVQLQRPGPAPRLGPHLARTALIFNKFPFLFLSPFLNRSDKGDFIETLESRNSLEIIEGWNSLERIVEGFS
jgi:hypothetical protein